MDDASKRIAALSPEEKRALLAQLLRKKVGQSRERFPLSAGQRALWFLFRLAPESAAYNLLYSALVHTDLDIHVLQHAVQTLLRRYPILTATYGMDEKEPYLQFNHDLMVPVEVVDTTNWSLDVLRDRLDEEGNRPFDLERGPVLRLKLYKRSTQESILALTVHHIAVDLWALDLLMDELCIVYAAEKAGVQAPLPQVATQFTDYVRWQTAMLEGHEGEQHWLYWQQRMSGELPILNLPTDRPRPPVQTYRGAPHTFAFDQELSKQLRALAGAEKVTLYTLMLAAYELLLFRLTDQEDLVIGTTALGRNRADLERVIGYLANPVPLRTDFSGSPSFRELLSQVRQNVGGALEHQDFPFPLLVERLQPKRDPSYSPLIQTLFIWDKPRNYGATEIAQQLGRDPATRQLAREIPIFEPFIARQQGAPFDLTLTIFELENALTAEFHYNVDLFDTTTIERIERHFHTLLAGIVTNPDQPILELPILTAAGLHTMLVDWNATERPYPDHTCIHQQIEQQVERTPDAIALEFEGEQLTYKELNKRANRLAHTLRERGVGPEILVGVCMERSVEMVVALLAVLKAGGAYVPLEPAYPRDRLLYMLQDSHAPVLLTQSKWRDLIGKADAHVLYLDNKENDWNTSAPQRDENPNSEVQPDNLIYVIYTSGSTGRPKGVMNTHRGLSNRLHWMQQEYHLTLDDRVLQKTPFSFDVSVWEFFWPLLAGARLIVARPGVHQYPAYLMSLIQECQITTLHFVPSMLQAFLDEPGIERCTSLKRVICSGEALTYEMQERFFARSQAELHNLFGPTEAAIDVTYWQCKRNSHDPVVPIGRPIDNTQIYILNRALQPVPIGVAGELCIGGVGVARGYLNQLELTAEKFILDPFNTLSGARMFKTGDLARFRPDGVIEFLGRIDHQVKIRGVRIELGEIEAALAQHPEIREVVVSAREDIPGHKRLVAYLVFTKEARERRIPVDELRSFLKEKLPQDMIPSSFVFLDEMPLMPNGKVNRQALPAPDMGRPELEATYVAPRTPEEVQLARIWEQVLGIERVGIHDNFFDLGGASIESLQVVSKANELGFHLTPELIFEYQTVAELAEVAAQKQSSQPTPPDDEDGQKQLTSAHTPELANSPAKQQTAQPAPGNTLIESLGVYLPPKAVTTKEILANCVKPVRFPMEQLTGIRSRRMAGETEFAYDLARKAVADCLANSRYNPEDIDLLICSSISRCNGPNTQFMFEPSTALLLQQHFGFANALAFDITNACTGMFTGMYIVDAFLKAGLIRRGLVVSGEYITHLTKTAQKEIESYMDSRLACLTVGDAGAAVILEQTPNKALGFHEFEMFTLGHYYDLCIAKQTEMEHSGAIMYTDAVKVSAVNIQHAVAHAASVIERSGWQQEAFQHVLVHQTSKTTIYDAAREINKYFGKELLHKDQVINNITDRGNTASTTHMVALKDHILSGTIQSNSNIIFGATGSGVNIGTAIYTLDDLPDRLRRYANGERPEKVPATREQPRLLLPPERRVRIESLGTLPLAADGKRETLEMVRAAAERCFASSSHDKRDIDLLLYAGVFRDEFLCEPSIASMIAGTLQINDLIESPQDKKTFSFDLLNSSTGFLNACYTAIGMMKGHGAKNVMIAVSEVENNASTPLPERRGIGETSSVAILDESADGRTGFGNFVFRSFTEYVESLTAYTVPLKGQMGLHIEQNPQLEDYYLSCIQKTVRELLELEGLDLSQIKLVLPPQISSSFITRLSEDLELGREMFVDVHATRDLFTSSLPYALQYAQEEHCVKPGDVGLLISVGAGIQVGCATYYF